jgi:hypothetical protein
MLALGARAPAVVGARAPAVVAAATRAAPRALPNPAKQPVCSALLRRSSRWRPKKIERGLCDWTRGLRSPPGPPPQPRHRAARQSLALVRGAAKPPFCEAPRAGRRSARRPARGCTARPSTSAANARNELRRARLSPTAPLAPPRPAAPRRAAPRRAAPRRAVTCHAMLRRNVPCHAARPILARVELRQGQDEMHACAKPAGVAPRRAPSSYRDNEVRQQPQRFRARRCPPSSFVSARARKVLNLFTLADPRFACTATHPFPPPRSCLPHPHVGSGSWKE